MSEKAIRKFQKELNSGAVSLVLLSVIHKHREPMYGYEIAKRLNELTDGDLPMNQAAIYPVLRSLEKQELLRHRLIPSESGPPRKYYQLTSAGKRALRDWELVWKNTTSFVDFVLEMNNAESAKSGRKVSRTARTGAKKKSGR